jgi:hypothetical protein
VKRVLALSVALVALVLAPAGGAGGPRMLVGAAEDVVEQPTLVAAKAHMDLARLAGLNAIRSTAIWAPGQTAPEAAQLAALKNAAAAAHLDGVTLIVSVYQFGSKTTPLTDREQADFAAFAASLAKALPTVRSFVIGNEPNINRYWLPQFNPDGSDAAAQAYESLLAKTYDAVKAVDPAVQVLGGAVSPRGGDNPQAPRLTHSPSVFIADMGAAYRSSGRTEAIMDALAFHPYMDNSSQVPTVQHPNTTTISINDYAKLVRVLGAAFDGTAQPGSTLPIVYDEFGVESLVPAAKAPLYSGKEPATTKPVDEATQALYYGTALALAFCQANVRGLSLFHTEDEPALDRWQSGLYYTDGTAKASLAPVKAAIALLRRGSLARCPGLKLPVKAAAVAFPTPRVAARKAPLAVRFRCDLDCTFWARLERLPKHATVTGVRGRAVGGKAAKALVPRTKKLEPGLYRFTLRLTAALNPGTPAVRASRAFRIR